MLVAGTAPLLLSLV